MKLLVLNTLVVELASKLIFRGQLSVWQLFIYYGQSMVKVNLARYMQLINVGLWSTSRYRSTITKCR